MKNTIKKRVIKEAYYMIEKDKTIREIAKEYKVSKSTVHKDLKDRLKNIDNELYKNIKIIINKHIETRHIKGGESTKKKYQKIAKNNVKK